MIGLYSSMLLSYIGVPVNDRGATGKVKGLEQNTPTRSRSIRRGSWNSSSNPLPEEILRVKEGEKYEIDVALTDKDAEAWRIKKKNKVVIVLNLYWYKDDYNREDKFEKLVEDINSAIIHEILHEEVGTENEYIIEKLEKLLVKQNGRRRKKSS